MFAIFHFQCNLRPPSSLPPIFPSAAGIICDEEDKIELEVGFDVLCPGQEGMLRCKSLDQTGIAWAFGNNNLGFERWKKPPAMLSFLDEAVTYLVELETVDSPIMRGDRVAMLLYRADPNTRGVVTFQCYWIYGCSTKILVLGKPNIQG